MLKIKEAIIVEGRYDKIKLSSILDAVIIETEGFGIFNNKEKQRLIRRLAEKNGILILTDSDSAGFKIRSFLGGSIKNGQVMNLDFFSVTDILSGSLPGAMGTTSLLTLFAVGLYLFISKKERLIPSFGFILSSGIFALLFPRVSSGRLISVFLELSAGGLIFTALLLINHPVTLPSKKLHGFLYGLSGGVITMALRHFSPVLMPEIFSVLIMNALLPAVTGETVNRKVLIRKERQLNETTLS